QTPQSVLSYSWPRSFPRMAIATCAFAIATDDSRLWIKRAFHLFVGGPPVRAFDLGDTITDERFRCLDVVQFARVLAQELGLIRLRQLAFAHRLNCTPRVVSIMVIDIRGPCQDLLVKLWQS